MTLESIYYVSQIIAVLAVLASLIFVGIQIRQNTEQARRNEEAIKATAAEAAFRSFLDWYYNQTADMAAITTKATRDFQSLSAEERYLFFANWMPFLMNLQEAHSKWMEGALVEERWKFWDQLAITIALSPALINVWETRRFAFSEAFQTYMDAKIKNEDTIPETVASWVTPSESEDASEPMGSTSKAPSA